jgi:hypothetical protein
MGVLRKLSTPDFFFTDSFVRRLFAARAAHFRGERNRFSGLSTQSLDRI